MILLMIIITYIRDCKKIGKDNLAVPLHERLAYYIILVVLPLLMAIFP